MKKILSSLLVAAMAVSLVACGGSNGGGSSSSTSAGGSSSNATADAGADSGETYNLKFSFEGSKGLRMLNIWEAWEEKVTEKSEGRITFTNYYDSTLLDPNSEVDQLKAGIADFGDIHKYSKDGFVIYEKWKGFTMGTPIDGQVEIAKTLYDEFPELQKECEIFKVLAMAFDGGSYQLLTVNKEVKTVEDCKGMVIWCEADFNDFFEALGATPVNTPWSEVYSSLQKNMYDGMFIAAETLQAVNFAEVCKFTTLVNLNYLAGPGHFMCLDTYNALPDDLKAVIDDPELIAEVEKEMAESAHTSEAEVIEWAKTDGGVTFIELSKEEQQRFVDVLNGAKQSVASEFDAAGLPGSDILNRMIELSKNY